MEVILFAFFFVGLAMRFPALIRITLGGIVLFYVAIYAFAFVWWIISEIWKYLILKPYKRLDKKYFQHNKILRWIFSINWFYLLLAILFIAFIAWGFYIPETYYNNLSNNKNNYTESQIINTNNIGINTWNESDLITNSNYIIWEIDDITREKYKATSKSPYEWCSYIWADWKRHKCDDSLVDDSDYDPSDPINYNPERIDNTPIAVIPETHIPTATIPKSQTPKTQNYYDWYDDPEPSEFYEYDNFDDYYDNYWYYYDDYSYDELKDMYNDEKRSNSPYQWYEDYYEDLRYDYYWWYGWYDKHIDEFEDEYWYFEE